MLTIIAHFDNLNELNHAIKLFDLEVQDDHKTIKARDGFKSCYIENRTLNIQIDVTKELNYNWAKQAISHLPEKQKEQCRSAAYKIVENGGLKGNISDAWRSLNYTLRDIPEMFV